MKFHAHIADRETGEESFLDIRSETVQKAREQLLSAGYLIHTITPIIEDDDQSPGSGASRSSRTEDEGRQANDAPPRATLFSGSQDKSREYVSVTFPPLADNFTGHFRLNAPSCKLPPNAFLQFVRNEMAHHRLQIEKQSEDSGKSKTVGVGVTSSLSVGIGAAQTKFTELTWNPFLAKYSVPGAGDFKAIVRLDTLEERSFKGHTGTTNTYSYKITGIVTFERSKNSIGIYLATILTAISIISSCAIVGRVGEDYAGMVCLGIPLLTAIISAATGWFIDKQSASQGAPHSHRCFSSALNGIAKAIESGDAAGRV